MWRPLCSVELGRTLGGARINIVIRHGRICGQRSSARIVTLRLAAYGQACVQVSIRSDLGLTDLIRCTGSGRICLRQDQFRGRGKFVHTSLSYASLHSGKAEQHGRTRGHDAYPAKSSIHSCCPFWKSAPISDYDTEVVNDADTTVELVMHHIARTRPGDSSMNSPILSINRSINRGAAHNPLRVKAVVLTGSPRTDGPFGQVQGVGRSTGCRGFPVALTDGQRENLSRSGGPVTRTIRCRCSWRLRRGAGMPRSACLARRSREDRVKSGGSGPCSCWESGCLGEVSDGGFVSSLSGASLDGVGGPWSSARSVRSSRLWARVGNSALRRPWLVT